MYYVRDSIAAGEEDSIMYIHCVYVLLTVDIM